MKLVLVNARMMRRSRVQGISITMSVSAAIMDLIKQVLAPQHPPYLSITYKLGLCLSLIQEKLPQGYKNYFMLNLTEHTTRSVLLYIFIILYCPTYSIIEQ